MLRVSPCTQRLDAAMFGRVEYKLAYRWHCWSVFARGVRTDDASRFRNRRASSIYAANHLERRDANFRQLTPLMYLERAALVWPDRVAVRFEGRSTSYYELYADAKRLASALRRRGIKRGDTVTIFSSNSPECLTAHYGVPGANGAVIHTVNTRLDASTFAFMLQHAETKVLMFESSFSNIVQDALKSIRQGKGTNHDWPLLVEVLCSHDESSRKALEPLAADFLSYASLLSEGDTEDPLDHPEDEFDAIALNYTSGTGGRPKGVVYSHRGCYLQAVSTPLFWRMPLEIPVFLWVSPMFHCCGWHFPWTLPAVGGMQVCLRSPQPELIFNLIQQEGVTHLGGAPTVLTMLANASPEEQRPMVSRGSSAKPVQLLTAGSPPPPAVLSAIEALGFEVTHMYGLTETNGQCLASVHKSDKYGPLSEEEQAKLKARQGVPTPLLGGEVKVVRLDEPAVTANSVDVGPQMGEIIIRGNTVMKGYLKAPESTEEAFEGGWFRSGDLATVDEEHYISVKDRKKDIIVTGGENVSTVEVEAALFGHPHVAEAAVVARPHEKWGETVMAFVVLNQHGKEACWDKKADAFEDELISFCRKRLAGFKLPRVVRLVDETGGGLPKTSTGKVQKHVLRDIARSEIF